MVKHLPPRSLQGASPGFLGAEQGEQIGQTLGGAVGKDLSYLLLLLRDQFVGDKEKIAWMFPGVAGLQASLRSHNRILKFSGSHPHPGLPTANRRPVNITLPLFRMEMSKGNAESGALTSSALMFLPLPPSEPSGAALSSVPLCTNLRPQPLFSQ